MRMWRVQWMLSNAAQVIRTGNLRINSMVNFVAEKNPSFFIWTIVVFGILCYTWSNQYLFSDSYNYLVSTRMRIKRDTGKGLCTRGKYSSEFSVGCTARFFKSWPYFRPKHAIFHTFIRSRGSLENHTRWMVKIYIRFQTKTAEKAYSLGRTYLYSWYRRVPAGGYEGGGGGYDCCYHRLLNCPVVIVYTGNRLKPR